MNINAGGMQYEGGGVTASSAGHLVAWAGCLLIGLYTILLMHVDIAHPSGTGVTQPQNLFTWSLVGALMILAACRPLPWRGVKHESFLLLCLAGVVVLSLPLWYAPTTWRYLAEMRVAGLWGGLLLMVACRALFGNSSLRTMVLILLLLGCVIEALIGIAELLVPHALPTGVAPPLTNQRIGGVFMQPNVLASWVSTGLAVTCLLNVRLSGRIVRALLLMATFVLAVCLSLAQSTIGALGAGVSLVMALLYFRRHPHGVGLWLVFFALGVCGGAFLWGGHHGEFVSHGRSGRVFMLHTGLWLFSQHPWLGVGYGHFEMAYVQGWEAMGGRVPVQDHALLPHPHNELLFWLMEGGLVAGMGLLCFLWAGVILTRRCWRLAIDKRGDSDAFGVMCCALPILMHTQVEYPMYQSAWHYVAVLLFLSMADGASKNYPPFIATTVWRNGVGWLVRVLMLIGGLGIITYMLTALPVGLQLTLAEQGATPERLVALQNTRTWNPWVMAERAWRVEAVGQAARAQETGDMSLLLPVIAWEEQYLLRHPDADFTALLIRHLQLTGQAEGARAVQERAARMFPWDPRFMLTPDIRRGPVPDTTTKLQHDES